MSPPLRILLLDDHQLFLTGLRLILERETGYRVVGEAGDGATAMALVESLKPDLVVADVHLPSEDGIAVASRIRTRHPAIKFLFLSSDADVAVVRRALDTGYAVGNGRAMRLLRSQVIYNVEQGLVK